ncbi:MAG TPA: hypothetical protein VIH87_01975 [Methylocella sp.]
MVAIRRFVTVRPAAELQGTTLYTSGEPCPMCMSAIVWCVASAGWSSLPRSTNSQLRSVRSCWPAARWRTQPLRHHRDHWRGAVRRGETIGLSYPHGSCTFAKPRFNWGWRARRRNRNYPRDD